MVVELCHAKEIYHIVISPGSRNAPLIIGFTSHPDFTCYSVVDERCAAFFALGLAQQLKKPVAVICTSGSATLNYYPAVAEAFYSNIPLVVISADRPSYLVDIGDGQTIRQENVYTNHIEFSACCKEGDAYLEFNEIAINNALNTAIEKQGPVHINVPFSEPLYERIAEKRVTPVIIPAKVIRDTRVENLNTLVEQWNCAKKKMILVGTLHPMSIDSKYIDILAADDSVIVLTETTSNLHHKNFFPSIDQLISSLNEEESKSLQPEILLTFGGMIVSKRIKALLRKYTPNQHWHIDPKCANDTFFCLTEHIKNTPNYFFRYFLPLTQQVLSNYQKQWLQIKNEKKAKQTLFENNVPFSDFKVYATIFASIPKHMLLQLANSTAIRYAQLFSLHPSFRVFCNRGTSGIDGTTSTAIGAAVASQKPTLLLTGDLSFFYDSNALWNSNIPKSFRIIVVNNAGGGIFRILPKAKDVTYFEEFFETKHTLSAKHLCNMFGFEYQAAVTQEVLETTLKDFYEEGECPKLLEIFTPSHVNDVVLNEYFKTIS